ncbi:two component histidine kinase 1 [Didymella exigua CBS 183.55]|uniref:histidine kinase n=1 Tax=Didymella exigua CBS 183.55 TaxID=1150837 RepID=A0A6A5S1D6_9PLEO|nr:two component histidine kinase 1 [Didymella exigua CBS 183.55]KAF1933410.1 two component histidine kinase 1 [Didymella exigua CBS 183.55]
MGTFIPFDVNSRSLDNVDWSKTAIGPRDSWSPALKCLVNSCVLPMTHCCAIFWGSELTVIANSTWGKARGNLDGQGTSALRTYKAEALSTLQRVLRGRTVKVDARFFLQNISGEDEESQILLSTLLDADGNRQGVLAQLMQNNTVEKYTALEGLSKLAHRNPAKTDKRYGSDKPDGQPNDGQKDAMQTQLFQRFAELLPNGLAILDKELEAIFVNDGFFRLTTNKMANEFRAWPESIHPDDYDRVMTAYRKAFSLREDLRIEFRCTSEATGEAGEWRLFLFRPLSEDPEAGFICAVVDITEIKQAELAQEKAATEAQDRKEQQERFIDMVSHEIRNPLSAVMHLAEEVKEVIREIGTTHEDIKEQVSDIMDAADTILLCVSHQNTLVDDILSFSKLDSMMLSLVPRVVRPKWEFSQSLKVFQSEFRAKSIKFHYAMDISYDDQSVDHVIADLNRMKQVLVNLITNAVKFTSRKTGERKITVSMGASIDRPTSYPPNVIYFGQDKETFHIDSTRSSEWGDGDAFYLMVAVKDSGIGISKEDQAKLFERFRQATPKTQEKYGGSGLGLFISRKLCQLHGGDIGVSSKEGDGSTFGFFFKVRRSDGASNEDGRPPFGSRSNSEAPATPDQRSQTPRPGYSRANSNLQDIKERTNERGRKEIKMEAKENDSASKAKKDESKNEHKRSGLDEQLTSHADDIESLNNPPTEYFPEAHPESNEDSRYKETKTIAHQINPPVEGHDDAIPYSESGESVRQGAAADKAHKAHSAQQKDDKRTLLLVEDNLINQKVLRRQLQSRGFEVFVANNGQEAIDAVAKRGQTAAEDLNNRNYFDCILMDQEMPIKDGNQATSEIRQLQNEGKAGFSKILGVSANVREAQRDSMREAGMDDLISKPFKVDALVDKIDELTISSKDVNGEGGKLSNEAKRTPSGEQLKNGEPLVKGEKETKEKKREQTSGRMIDGEKKEEMFGKKQGENVGKEQDGAREQKGLVGEPKAWGNAKYDQANSISKPEAKHSKNSQSKEKSGTNQRSPQISDAMEEKTRKGLEQKG